MANLFLEINDNQKRVPSSLRWDLVRLVRPADDPHAIAASELTYDLATDEKSALFQRIDLTGDQDGITLKQGSIAPEIKAALGSKESSLQGMDYDTMYELLLRYFAAIKSREPSEWVHGKSVLYKGRILRAMIRLLPDLVTHSKKAPGDLSANDLLNYVNRIDLNSVTPEKLKAIQGPAGIQAIYQILKNQALPTNATS